MNAQAMLIFDDPTGRFGPLTDRRPAFDLTTGSTTNRSRITRVLSLQPTALFVLPALAEVMAARVSSQTGRPQPTINPDRLPVDPILLVNGRWLAIDAVEAVQTLEPGSSLVTPDGSPLAAHLPGEMALAWLNNVQSGVPQSWPSACEQRSVNATLIARPWDMLNHLFEVLTADLAACDWPLIDPTAAPAGVTIVGRHPVRIAPTARILPHCVVQAEQGPVVIDDEAIIQPFTSIEGPCYVGCGAELAAHTQLRPGVSLGQRCKVGGELKASILHDFSNKAHLGYLGDSIVGSFCNFGADTNVSNLKNTYGQVRIALNSDQPAEDTGRKNHGPIVGDLVRTAIGTNLLTGSVVGTGTMLAVSGFAPKVTPPFAFCTDGSEQPHNFDALIQTAHRMHASKKQTLTEAEVEHLRQLHLKATAKTA